MSSAAFPSALAPSAGAQPHRSAEPLAGGDLEVGGVGDEDSVVHEATRWHDQGWQAQVIKNEDDDGWAVSMTQAGQAEPALVGPWTMGRDKKNPKPLDAAAFSTLVKTASEVLRRHEQQLHAALHQQITVDVGGDRVEVRFDITPDDDGATALLRAVDGQGDELGRASAPPHFRLTRASALGWIEAGFPKLR